jgi:hypothetical protein
VIRRLRPLASLQGEKRGAQADASADLAESPPGGAEGKGFPQILTLARLESANLKPLAARIFNAE